MNITRMGLDHCPKCSKKLNAATSAFGENVPMPGDLTVCFYCAAPLRFEPDMELTALTEVEFELLNTETQAQLLKVIKAIKNRIKAETIGI